MTLPVTLTPDLEEIVNQQIATGQYATREEVIAASLDLLRDTVARKETELRALLDEAEETFGPVESHHSIHPQRPRG